MGTIQAILREFTPELRRYAFLLTGSPATGDDLVEACLRVAVGNPGRIRPEPRKSLYRVFHEANPVIPQGRRTPNAASRATGARLLNRLMLLSQDERAALVLRTSLGFEEADVADILQLGVERVRSMLATTRGRLARAELAQVLIIEDDFLIAWELSALVERMGPQVCGTAATYQEALRAAEACRPGLVLADIQLRDGPFTGLEAAHAIAQNSDSRVIIVTAYPERVAHSSALSPFAVLTKPFDREALGRTIDRSLMVA
jgi:DNA-directed RNA polymerase specialized sigma24 family protein